MALLIKPDHVIEFVYSSDAPYSAPQFPLTALQQFVGGYIESVGLTLEGSERIWKELNLSHGTPLSAYINKDDIGLGLPPNYLAAWHTVHGMVYGNMIVGAADEMDPPPDANAIVT